MGPLVSYLTSGPTPLMPQGSDCQLYGGWQVWRGEQLVGHVLTVMWTSAHPSHVPGARGFATVSGSFALSLDGDVISGPHTARGAQKTCLRAFSQSM
jgi:hypothetical protein